MNHKAKTRKQRKHWKEKTVTWCALAKLRPNIPVIAVIAYQAVSCLNEEECEAGLKTKSQLSIYKRSSFRINSLKKVEGMTLWKELSSDMSQE